MITFQEPPWYSGLFSAIAGLCIIIGMILIGAYMNGELKI